MSLTLKQYLSVKRGISTDLAKAIGVSKSYLNQMASGKTKINTERALLIEDETKGAVKAYGISKDVARVIDHLNRGAKCDT